MAEREARQAAEKSPAKSDRTGAETDKRKALAERFLSQSNAQNASDPDLRRAQTLVAQAMSIARARYPDDPKHAARDIETKRQEVATRIATGDPIAAVQIRNRQAARVREVMQDQAMTRGDRSR